MAFSSPNEGKRVSEIFAFLSGIFPFMALASKFRSSRLTTVPTPERHSKALMSKWWIGPIKQVIRSCHGRKKRRAIWPKGGQKSRPYQPTWPHFCRSFDNGQDDSRFWQIQALLLTFFLPGPLRAHRPSNSRTHAPHRPTFLRRHGHRKTWRSARRFNPVSVPPTCALAEAVISQDKRTSHRRRFFCRILGNLGAATYACRFFKSNGKP